jgi:hypothetical protein
MIADKYRGVRPVAEYPGCPDHTEKQVLWDLLDVEKKVGMELTSSYAMFPGSSATGLYFFNESARFFWGWEDWKESVGGVCGAEGDAVGSGREMACAEFGGLMNKSCHLAAC